MALSDEEKRKILEAIREDAEFRYTLMGLLGFREILDRITRLEERQQKLEERFARLEERFVKLEERQQELEKKFAELEERFARLEERQQELEKKFAELEERFARLEERFARLEERQQRLEERMIHVEKLVTTIAHRFGVITESSFREALSGILSKYFGATASKLSVYDEEGLVFGYPSVVDMDVVVRDNVHIVIEVKSRADPEDVYKLYRVGKLYEKKRGVKPRLALVAGYASGKAKEAASKLGVELYSYLED
jgi:hypothetical protein